MQGQVFITGMFLHIKHAGNEYLTPFPFFTAFGGGLCCNYST
jgi:hypothetical protein